MSVPNAKKTVAFFDVDGTLLKSTIVHCYVWIRSAQVSIPSEIFVVNRISPENCVLSDFGQYKSEPFQSGILSKLSRDGCWEG